MITVDFETEAIAPRPHYPPKPVGVAVKLDGGRSRYYAWGHPTGNNADLLSVKMLLSDIWRKEVLLFHNAKFDLEVAHKHLGLAPPPWNRVHDTLFLLFLSDPHAVSLGLKPSAERLLGLPPDERDKVRDWLIEHGVVTSKQNAGAFIARAPGDIVGKYAIGDVDRTRALYNLLMPKVQEVGMEAAYERERRLLPILMSNERLGMRVDLPGLERASIRSGNALWTVDAWLRKRLGNLGLNLDSDVEVAAALKKRKIVKVFPKTPTGRNSVSKKVLTKDLFSDPDVWLALYYRNALSTVLTMSIKPWLGQAAGGGFIFTDWNQVRQSHGVDGFRGARSGRVTCSYFQNISKSFVDRHDGYGEEGDARIRKLLHLPELPKVRSFLLPDTGDIWLHRDYNQQEMRIVAHYEEGRLAAGYKNDPGMDIHTFVGNLMTKATGKTFSRRDVKIINFQTVYGGGITALMNNLQISRQAAEELKAAWKLALPDVVTLNDELRHLFETRQSLRTWGGRVYGCKPSVVAKKGPRRGELIDYAYTALNYLIQPSGADITKEALVRYNDHPKRLGRLLVTVHDEINASVPAKDVKRQSHILKECLESVQLDVPWRSDGKIGSSWGTLEKET